MPLSNCSGDGSPAVTQSRQRGGGRGRNLPSALFTAVFVAAATGVCLAQQCRQADLQVVAITAPRHSDCDNFFNSDWYNWDIFVVSL